MHAQTQQGLQHSSVGLQVYYGSFISSATKAAYMKDSYSYFGEISYIKGATAYLPQSGIAVLYGNSGSKQYVGNIAAAYAFCNFNLYRTQKFSSSLRTGAGVGIIEKPYNVETNHKNMLLGSKLNLFIHLLWKNEFAVAHDAFINAGISLSHLSNGTTKLPNLGLNVPALSFGLRYAFNHLKTEVIEQPPMFNKEIKWQLLASAGIKQSPWINSNRRVVNVVSVEAAKQLSYNKKAALGLGLYHDPTFLLEDVDPTRERMTPKKDLNAALFGSYEPIIGRMSIPLQFGVYIIGKNHLHRFFQNVGARYMLSRRWAACLYLKTHWGKADYIHAGLGYTF
ncbi:MAG: acyloxyacyl hydrolase [Bacteroidota bacterium]|nr:acyloxyacyl hydrolase [Bacteroidota bacterium]